MLVVSKEVREAYAILLTKQGLTKAEQSIYQKWLRFYLDFCTKYQHDVSFTGSLDAFLKKLTEKRQSKQ